MPTAKEQNQMAEEWAKLAGIQDVSIATPTKEKEVRTVDPKTGGEKGMKMARFSLIPRDWLWALAEHYGKGARKYADRNWEKGYKWSLSQDAAERHLNQWLQGEDNDDHKPDCPVDCTEHTGSSHLICAAWHLIALWWFHKHGKGTNDIRNTPDGGVR